MDTYHTYPPPHMIASQHTNPPLIPHPDPDWNTDRQMDIPRLGTPLPTENPYHATREMRRGPGKKIIGNRKKSAPHGIHKLARGEGGGGWGGVKEG